jgi:colanic acid biosynthesis glycosyl transferase WcaI
VLDVLAVYQAFPPDPAAGGQCVADACATLAARGQAVRVIAADRGYDDPSRRFASRERMRGFDVRRVGFASFGKSSLFVRLAGGALFVAGAILKGITGPRPRVVVAGNSPPIGAIAGLALSAWHRAPLVYWLMDLHPDAAIAIGMVQPRAFSAKVFDWLNRQLLRRARTIIVMDDAMGRRITAKGPARARVLAIPPWGGPAGERPSAGAGGGGGRAPRRQGPRVGEKNSLTTWSIRSTRCSMPQSDCATTIDSPSCSWAAAVARRTSRRAV